MKKILAVILATATAVSMFATSVSAAFNFHDSIETEAYLGAYDAVEVEVEDNRIIVTQPRYQSAADVIYITDVEGVMDFIEHLNFEGTDRTPEIFEVQKYENDAIEYGTVYMYDYSYVVEPKQEKEHNKALEEFEEVLAEFSVSNPESVELTVADFCKAWADAYRTEPGYGMDNIPQLRADVIDKLREVAADSVQYMGYDKNGKNREPDSSHFDNSDYEYYNIFGLLKAAFFNARNGAFIKDSTTSELVYLAREYERVMSVVAFADTADQKAKYDELYEVLSEYLPTDFSEANWDEFQAFMDEAETLAENATTTKEWGDALAVLNKAKAIKGKSVKYIDIQRVLMSVYVDDNGLSHVNYLKEEYTGDPADYCLYNAEDYEVRKGVYTDEWSDFALNTYTYDTYANIIIDERGAYSALYKLWEDVKKNSTAVKQSEVDRAIDEFNAAVDKLTAVNGGSDEWLLVKLNEILDKAVGLKESDFNTTSKKWTSLQSAIDDAKNTLRKTKPSTTEVTKVTALLQKALDELKASAKNVPSSLKNELKEAIIDAIKLLENFDVQTGEQVTALRNAKFEADEVYTTLVMGNYGADKYTISEVQTALDNLNDAIERFTNPDIWRYENGKWYYGAHAGEWYRIGATWFMFNEDGSMKANEWFIVDGKWYYANENGGLAIGWAMVDGKWYFFNQGNAMVTGWAQTNGNWYYLASSGAMITGWNWIGGNCYYFYDNGAMAFNTVVDGYSLGADGAWIA